jgi:transmembrane sensor
MPRDYPQIDVGASLTEQASAWWMLLNYGDVKLADHHAFRKWVARSPERVEAFLQTAILTRALESKQLWPDTPIETLIQDAKSATKVVTHYPAREPFSPPGTSTPRSERRALSKIPRPLVLIATTLMLLVSVAMTSYFSGIQRFQTSLGEQRSVVLSDGSVVTLNTSSLIEVHMAKHHRTVELRSGEALFEVAHDSTRPFVVAAGNATVRAVGTRFNVDRRSDSTTITVVEGKVAVFTGIVNAKGDTDELPLAAREQLTVRPHAASRPVPANLGSATAWTQRKLVFEHRALGEVAEEFNRYNLERIVIDSSDLRNEEITGAFEANNPASFMSFLAKLPDVRIERIPGENRFIVTRANGTAGH